MARIIRTTPNSRKRVSLRVVFSFLLFMQIQLPDAREAQTPKVTDLSFHLASKAMPHITITKPEAVIAESQKANKIN